MNINKEVKTDVEDSVISLDLCSELPDTISISIDEGCFLGESAILNENNIQDMILALKDMSLKMRSWHKSGLTPPKDQPMEMTEENFSRVIAMRYELILEMKSEISALKGLK